MLQDYIKLNETFAAPVNRFPKETPPKISVQVLHALIKGSYEYAKHFDISARDAYNQVLFPVCWSESTFDPDAHNGSFKGLFQFNAKSAKEVNLAENKRNIPLHAALAFARYSNLQISNLKTYFSGKLPVKNDSDFLLVGGKKQFSLAMQELKTQADLICKKPYFMYLLHQQGAWGFTQIYVLGKSDSPVKLVELDSGSERSVLANIGDDWQNMDFGKRPKPSRVKDITINDFVYYWKYKMAARVATGTPYEWNLAREAVTNAVKKKTKTKN